MLYHVLICHENIGTSICNNILYKHNIVLRMYCMLLLYNLRILLTPIQHIRISCPFDPLIIGHQGLLHLPTTQISRKRNSAVVLHNLSAKDLKDPDRVKTWVNSMQKFDIHPYERLAHMANSAISTMSNVMAIRAADNPPSDWANWIGPMLSMLTRSMGLSTLMLYGLVIPCIWCFATFMN